MDEANARDLSKVRIDYTIDTKRGPTRKSVETTVAKLDRTLSKLEDKNAYQIETRYELTTAAKQHRHDFSDGDVCSTCDAVQA